MVLEGESHEQDGETLPTTGQSGRRSAWTAPGDPAMAFEPSVGSPGLVARDFVRHPNGNRTPSKADPGPPGGRKFIRHAGRTSVRL